MNATWKIHDRCALRGILVAGITGGVATGKSTVTQRLRGRGVTVFSADEAARATLTPSVLEAIAAAFGPEIRRGDGSLDRARLAARIFDDPDAREVLNQITHPPILRLLRAQIESACDDLAPGEIVGVEVPLLYETELSDWFHCVIVVSASEPVQVARLSARNKLAETEARRRIAAQQPLAAKEARADYIIRNDGSPEALAQAVDELLARLRGENGVSS